MSYTALGRCASSGVVYDIHPSFSVFNSNLISGLQNQLVPKAHLQVSCSQVPKRKRLFGSGP